MTWDSSRITRYHSASRKRVVGFAFGSASSSLRNLSHAFHSIAYDELHLRKIYDCSVSGQDDIIFHEFGSGFGPLSATRRVVNIRIQRGLCLRSYFIEPLTKESNGCNNQCRLAFNILRPPGHKKSDTTVSRVSQNNTFG